MPSTLLDQFFSALEKKNEKQALELIAQPDFPLDGKDGGGLTPLHWACDSGMEAVALALIEKGARLDEKDGWEQTPLHWACESGLETVALALIEKGVPLDEKDGSEQTPLHLACEKGLETVALALIEKGAPLDEKGRSEQTPLEMLGNAEDMYAAFNIHLLRAAIFVESQGDENITAQPFYGLDIDNIIHPLPKLKLEPEQRSSQTMQARLMHRMRLSRTWHHATIQFPDDLLPYKANRKWQPLLKQPFECSNGLQITCLTSSNDLREESRILGHCVGKSNYDAKCCENDDRSHILSIRDKDDHPISTIELKCGSGGELIVLQHEDKGGKNPTNESVQAWQEFERAVQTGEATLTPQNKLGEISQPPNPDIPISWEKIGYEPTWENINKAFDEYKMPYRRASLPTDGRRMEYDDITSEDGYTRQHHFIDGYAILDQGDHLVKGSFQLTNDDYPPLSDGQRLVSVRELDAKSYLCATGLMDLVHQAIDRELGKDPKRTKRWEDEANQPVTFRAVPTPRHEIIHAIGKHGRKLGAEARREADGTYFGRS